MMLISWRSATTSTFLRRRDGEMGIPFHRGTKEERAAIEKTILETLERCHAEGILPGMAQLHYEIPKGKKFSRADLERAVGRLSDTNQIEYFPQLRGWVLIQYRQRALDAITKLNGVRKRHDGLG